jgi:hypothetical protein
MLRDAQKKSQRPVISIASNTGKLNARARSLNANDVRNGMKTPANYAGLAPKIQPPATKSPQDFYPRLKSVIGWGFPM